MLTRDQMLAIIRGGGSVIYGVGAQSRIISREADLPSDAEVTAHNAAYLALIAAQAAHPATIAAATADYEHRGVTLATGQLT